VQHDRVRPFRPASALVTLIALAATTAAPGTPPPPTPTPPVEAPNQAPNQAPAGAAADAQNAQVRRFFAPLTSVLSDALERLDRDRELPESAWNPLTETKRSNNDRINELLDECAEILTDGSVTDVRKRLRELDAERTALDAELRVALERQASARPKSERDWYEVFGRSREDWESAIAKAQERRDAIDTEIADLRRAFASHVAELGLELGPGGHDALLTTVAGDRFTDMVVAFDNVRLVTEQLRRITERMSESPETARRYYGMYVLLVRIMDRVQDAFVEHVETVAMPKVAAFGAEAQETERQAKSLLKGSDEATRQLLEKNIAACKLAQDAVANYTTYLKAQVDRVRELNRTVERRLKVAENTYRTMTVSVGIAELIREGELDLEAVMSMDLPALRGFENEALREQYRLLNERLGAPR
jgi:hypothetical protein